MTSGVDDRASEPCPPDAPQRDAQLPDRDWRILPPGAHRVGLAVPSGELAGFRMGPESGAPVVLVPGVTGSKEDFALVAPLLAAAGYHVLSFDLAGQFESAAAGPERLEPPRPRYDDALFVDDLIAVLEHLGAPAHVLGSSYAGTIAQLGIAHRPELFASLTLMSCPPLPGQVFRGIRRFGALSRFAGARLSAALMIWGVRANLVPVPPGRLAFVRSRFALTRRSSVVDVMRSMRRTPDLRAALAAVTVPKLVVAGDADLWPEALHRRFAREIRADFTAYASGHSPCETAPHQLVCDLIRLYASAADAATRAPRPS